MMSSSKKTTRQTDAFRAGGDDGKTYDVHEFTQYVGFTALEHGRTEWTPGLKSYRLRDGNAVNKVTDTEFVVVASGVKVTRMP